MFENIIKYVQKNKERLLIVIGEVAIIVSVVYLVSEFLDYLTDQDWFRFDPFLAIVVIYLGWRFSRSLNYQNKIIEQQAKILEKVVEKEKRKSVSKTRKKK